jgi:bifunctional non-homologous end joining protein LigD
MKSGESIEPGEFIAPELAFQATEPPSGDEWIHELKYDGYRVQAVVNGKNVRLLTRKGLDWTARMSHVADGLAGLALKKTVLDGEVVVLNAQGQSDFAALQAAFQGDGRALVYYVFDLLVAGGKEVRPLPLSERKARLRKLVPAARKGGAIRYSDHFIGTGAQLFAEACRLGAEGIVSKRTNSAYRGGRQPDWLKVKCYKRQELVIGGFTLPANHARGVGALLLGYYRDGKLIHAGRTGTGFTDRSGQDLRARLEKIKTDAMPFVEMSKAASKGAIWVHPKLVCEVSFSNWTADGMVRQASFQGIREDKNADEVVREEAVETKKLVASKSASQRASKSASQRVSKSASQRVSKSASQRVSKSASQQSKAKPSPKSETSARKTGAPTQLIRQGAATEPALIALTHPGKILDAESGVTKQQLADYLAAVTNAMLPHVEGRPLSLVRCPDGVGGQCFYQKHTSRGMPEGVGGVDIPDRKGDAAEEYVTIHAPEGLVGMAQMGVLEVHPWGSKNNALEKPDRLIFDLDPDPALAWKVIVEAALRIRKRLAGYGLKTTFVKLSGGKGLHVVAPVTPKLKWPEIKLFCRGVAEEIEAQAPQLYLIRMTKADRVGKIFIDYLRNERGATAVAPWSPRARKGMPVAVPLSWDELLEQKKVPVFRVDDFAKWQERVAKDPWKKMAGVRQAIKD